MRKPAALVLRFLGMIGAAVSRVFLRIFPRRETRYYDADLHETKYILLMAVSAVCIDLYMEWFARLSHGPFQVFKWIAASPAVFLYNCLIIFSTMTLALLFRKRRFAWFIISLLWVVIGTVNGFILLSRMTPFTLYDLQNFADGLTIATTYYKRWQIVLAAAAAVAGMFAIVMLFIRSRRWMNIRYARSAAAVIISLGTAAAATAVGIHMGMIGTFFGNLNYAYRDYGLAYCFIETSANAGISRPLGYSQDMISRILSKKTEKGSDTALTDKNDSTDHPNIIVLQMESFTVAQDYSNISVDRDPTPVFNRLSREYSSGRFIVPACGAGTANTEFEVLTGISARFFGPGEYPYKGKLRKKTLENMAYVTKSHGYATNALHNHRALFYNRNEVYANLGFDSFTSVEYMNNLSFTPSNWCKDKVLTREIMEIMTDTEERDFLHVISVEGHGAYPSEQVFRNPYTVVTADDEYTKWRYEYYLNECHEMDNFIGSLIREIEKAGEPTIMIIYGDHIPALDVKEENYKAEDLYRTRYVIWDNIGLEKEDRDLYSYQSGAVLLEKAGLAHEGVIFDYQQTAESRSRAEGRGSGGAESVSRTYLDDLEALAYDMLYGKYYVYGGSNPYEASDLRMGHKNIVIKEVVKIGDRYYIRGKNFTERSIISLDGRQLSTVYLSPTLLALNEDIDEEDIERLSVSQVDKSEQEILTTVGANEEL